MIRYDQKYFLDALCRLEMAGYKVYYIWNWTTSKPNDLKLWQQLFLVFGPEGLLFIALDHKSTDQHPELPVAKLNHLKEHCEEILSDLCEIEPNFRKIGYKIRLWLSFDQHDEGATPFDVKAGYLFLSQVWGLQENVDQLFLTLRSPGATLLKELNLIRFTERVNELGMKCIPILDFRLNWKPQTEQIQLKSTPSTIYQGGPGTGKTVHLMDLADKASRKDQSILFVCYNRPLAKYLQLELDNLPKCVMLPLLTYCEILSRKIDTKAELPKDEKEYWNHFLPLQAEHYLAQNEKVFDVVIVDEAQDLRHSEWWNVLKRSIKPGGTWYIAWDPGQGIYLNQNSETQDDPSTCFPQDLLVKELNTNYRNHKKITTELNRSGYWKLQSAYQFQSSGGGHIEFIQCSQDESAWIRALTALLKQIPLPMGSLYEPGLVIIGPKRFEKSLFALRNQYEFANYKVMNEKDYTEYHPQVIPYYTVHRFKGLEAERIILLDFGERQKNKRVDRLFYLGLSRARNGIWVLDV